MINIKSVTEQLDPICNKITSNLFLKKKDGMIYMINLCDICVIQASSMYTSVTLKNEEITLCRFGISEWEDILHKSMFIRVHRSYIINIAECLYFDTDMKYVHTTCGIFPVGASYKKLLLASFHCIK